MSKTISEQTKQEVRERYLKGERNKTALGESVGISARFCWSYC